MLKKLVPYISAIFVDLGALMSGPLSVIFGLLAAFNVIGQRKLFAALMVAALIVLVLRQAKKILELREKLRPKFQVVCDTSIDGCHVLSYLNTGNGTPMGSSFYRVKVCVNGAEEIKECTGYITLIHKDSLVRMGHENLRITFAPGDEPDCLSKTIRAHVPEFLDVLAVMEDGRIGICTKGFKIPNAINPAALFNERGEYIFEVVIAGKDVPSLPIKLKFYWSGARISSTLTLIEEVKT
jgi:hypothetical protein